MHKMKQRPIELLAPAKNLECGIEAINHGADAVYIGAPRFGARAAAGNSLADIEALVQYAHLYNVRIYVTVNTILRDDELKETEAMIWDLYRVGVDALIVQDMGLTQLNLPPIPLHASTQMDNRTVEKVRFLADAGFRQVVLARELSVNEISSIHAACPDTLLEVFIHGALCVSYSGQCYVSEACFGRSANRGECAQFCRLQFDMTDADGKVIEKGKHLLSLKDINQSDNLEELLDAGASSLKIEGRLKDVSYVKNVTAYYRQKLDALFKRRKEYVRASSGSVKLAFRPQLDKSFSRGFTDYFAHGRNPGIFSFNTPKSLGEEVGTVKEIRGNYLTVAGVKAFSNGDGLCYLDAQGRLQGFRVHRVENNKLFPQEMPRIKPKTVRYRNFDQERMPETEHPYPQKELTYLGNVMNKEAAAFYQKHGVERIAPAFEVEHPEGAALMFCKHCLRYSMGWCPVHHKVKSPYREPYYLVSGDGKKFRLQFDCKNCQMKVYSES